MGRRTWAVFGAGAAIGATVAALVSSGTLSSPGVGARSLTGLLTPPAAAAASRELPAFRSCAQLRRWYVEAALPQVTPYGFDTPYVITDLVRGPVPVDGHLDAAASPQKAVGSSGTGTNVQEAGVDEPDVAKTDGRLVVSVDGQRLIVTDVRGRRPKQLSTVPLPRRLTGGEVLLDGDHALVMADEALPWPGPVVPGPRPFVPGGPVGGPIREPLGGPGRVLPPQLQQGSTHLVSVDLSNPAAPRIVADQRVDGDLVSARQYPDGTVRVVLTAGYPPLDFVFPNRDRSKRQALRENRQIVRSAPLTSWLPRVHDGSGSGPLLGCTDVRHPRVRSGFGTISVLTLPGGDPTRRTTTGITAAGDLVYSSADRLYVATTAGGGWRPLGMRPLLRREHAWLPRTQINAFALDGTRTTFTASGSVPGLLKDRWSMDAYGGRLRVATSLGRDTWRPRENAVFVLGEQAGLLRQVGRVDGIGRHQQIKSVRWFGDVAVLVSYYQVDPFYTVDLSVPARPRVAGRLEVPGFSAYLHPVGGDRLLGVGTAAGSAQLATYDIHRLADVRRQAVLGLGAGTETAAAQDPRAFTYLPARRLALTSVLDERTGRSRLVAVRVGADGTLSEASSWPLRPWVGDQARTLPLGGDRVALVDHGDVHVLHLP
ncbi:MAG: beta-propeller domain-containing protein [Nocardioidaceae bacterium]